MLKIKPCPHTPNCVSSVDHGNPHYIQPLTYRGNPRVAREKLLAILLKFKRTRIVVSEPDYIHAEFKSAIFGFTDDVEFVFDDSGQTIQVRSASRTGYSDLGVNRRRIESIRKKMNG